MSGKNQGSVAAGDRVIDVDGDVGSVLRVEGERVLVRWWGLHETWVDTAELRLDDDDEHAADPVVTVDLDSMREERGEPAELRAYVAIDVAVNGTSYPVGCMVGAPESQDETCRAAGGYERPYLDAWWSDQGDWCTLPDARTAEAVLGALYGQRVAMWRRVLAAREAAS